MTTAPDRAAYAFVGAFIEELARGGLRHVCIAPGSRSTPLALTIARHPALRTWVHLDERSAAFFALGLARELGAPVALLCTSGTAAANFLPAVIEANAAAVPLLVLTADRPPELREVGAAQTIDQHRLYGTHAQWFVEVALPEASPDLLRYARTLAGRALARAATAPCGPVHLNFPFREPLIPVASEPAAPSEAETRAWHGRADQAAWVSLAKAAAAPDAPTVRRLAERLNGTCRPLIVCGPQYDDELATPLSALARTIGAPILADPLSQVRWGAHDQSGIIDRYDAALRDEATAGALTPDLVLRFGAVPTSKPLLQYLQRSASTCQIIVDAGRWPDPSLLVTEMIQCEPRLLCEALLPALRARVADPSWLRSWKHVDDRSGAALCAHSAGLTELFEGAVLAEATALMPSGSTVFVSSSMPVRDLDAFAAGDDRSLRVLGNRGANGIDGVVSTALGVSAALRERRGGEPLLLVIGDIAFYHDMNGLLAAKLYELDATILVINNDGGGIFSFLPQAALPEHFESLFGTPHGLEFEAVAALYGADYAHARDIAGMRAAVTAGLGKRGLHIVEIRTDRARNVELHRDAWAAVAASLDDPSA